MVPPPTARGADGRSAGGAASIRNSRDGSSLGAIGMGQRASAPRSSTGRRRAQGRGRRASAPRSARALACRPISASSAAAWTAVPSTRRLPARRRRVVTGRRRSSLAGGLARPAALLALRLRLSACARGGGLRLRGSRRRRLAACSIARRRAWRCAGGAASAAAPLRTPAGGSSLIGSHDRGMIAAGTRGPAPRSDKRITRHARTRTRGSVPIAKKSDRNFETVRRCSTYTRSDSAAERCRPHRKRSCSRDVRNSSRALTSESVVTILAGYV